MSIDPKILWVKCMRRAGSTAIALSRARYANIVIAAPRIFLLNLKQTLQTENTKSLSTTNVYTMHVHRI